MDFFKGITDNTQSLIPKIFRINILMRRSAPAGTTVYQSHK